MTYGFLNIYKPKGITSFDVIFKLRKILQIKKMGHTGTLDPMAEGVLIVALSEATKIIEFMMQHDKAYSAEITLGSESTTYDAEGELKSVGTQKPSFEEVEEVLGTFKGEVDQVPPIYSALKINGKKAYELAREGKKIEMKSRKVTISEIVLIDYEYPTLNIDVECSSGTYIRSLAHDIGKKLGTGAYLSKLIRTKVGHFLIEESVSLEDLEVDGLEKYLIPIEALSLNFPSVEVSQNELNKLNLGQFIEKEDINDELVCGFHDKKLIGILEKVKDSDKPLYKYKKKDKHMIQYLIPAAFSFISTLVLTMLALKFFPKWKMMDRPHKYGLKRKPIPYYGGLIFVLVFLVGTLLFVQLDMKVIGVLIGASMIAGISFLDDLKDVNPWIRLGVQFLGALTVVVSGLGIESISNPFGDPLVLDKFELDVPFGDTILTITLLADLFTVIWIILIVNTMNFLDGLNGLVSGVGFIAALTIFILSIGDHNLLDQSTVATMAVILAAALLAFWLFDFHPSKILMGDTGSMFIGFLIAVFAIFAGGKIATAFLVLGFPILDAFWVVTRRIVQGRSPMQGDLKHLHHRLIEVGLTERKALILIYILCAFFGGSAIFLGTTQKLFLLVAMGVFMVIMATIIVFYGIRKLKKG